MTDVQGALLGALIGAIAGLAGGGFAALSALRASQLAARAPLSATLHKIGKGLIRLRTAKGSEDWFSAILNFEESWNEFSIQQKILCPSHRIEQLSSLIRAAAQNKSDDPEDLLNLSGQTLEKISKMVGAHSNTIFRWKATRREAKIIRVWLNSPESQILSSNVRSKLQRNKIM